MTSDHAHAHTNRATDLIVIADQDYFDTSHHSGSRDYLDTGSAGFYPV